MKKNRQVILVLSFFLIISCCAHERAEHSDIAKGDIISIQQEPSPPSPFVVGAGDGIAINVWRHEDLNRTIQIDPSGNIYVPLAGEIKASGLTIPRLRNEIASRLSRYIIDPQVDISISSLKSRKVYVLGEIKSPGSFPLDQKVLAWEAISNAGGFTNDANKKNVLLVRSKNGIPTVAALNIHDILTEGKVTKNIYLKNGDVIYVLPTLIANIERFMSRFKTIISPLVDFERGIIFYPDVEDVLSGKGSGRGVIVAP